MGRLLGPEEGGSGRGGLRWSLRELGILLCVGGIVGCREGIWDSTQRWTEEAWVGVQSWGRGPRQLQRRLRSTLTVSALPACKLGRVLSGRRSSGPSLSSHRKETLAEKG